MNYISRNLRYLRKKANLTQEQFAGKVEMNRGNIASYEKGSAEPSIDKLQRIVQYFNTDLNAFIYKNLEEAYSTSSAGMHDFRTYKSSVTDGNISHENGGRPLNDELMDPMLGDIIQKEAELSQYRIATLNKLTSSLLQISKELHDVKEVMKDILKVNSQILARQEVLKD